MEQSIIFCFGLGLNETFTKKDPADLFHLSHPGKVPLFVFYSDSGIGVDDDTMPTLSVVSL